jgi:hypothetical protein
LYNKLLCLTEIYTLYEFHDFYQVIKFCVYVYNKLSKCGITFCIISCSYTLFSKSVYFYKWETEIEWYESEMWIEENSELPAMK